jgi:hypothetical protein
MRNDSSHRVTVRLSSDEYRALNRLEGDNLADKIRRLIYAQTIAGNIAEQINQRIDEFEETMIANQEVTQKNLMAHHEAVMNRFGVRQKTVDR